MEHLVLRIVDEKAVVKDANCSSPHHYQPLRHVIISLLSVILYSLVPLLLLLHLIEEYVL